MRAAASVLVRNHRGQSGLWGYAISGDLPIVLLQIADAENIELVRQLVQAHAYWRLKGLAVDLVIWNEGHDGYRQPLQEQIVGLIAAGVEAHFVDRPGGIFIRHAEQISSEDRVLFQSVARAIISDSRGTLAEQINRRASADVRVAQLAPTRAHRPQGLAQPELPRADLLFFNGTGGFSPRWPRIRRCARTGTATPAPWANVLANPAFRNGGVGKRARLHVGRERARVSAYAVAQRSGERGDRRSHVPARRGKRAFLVTDIVRRCRRRFVRDATRIRLQRFRAHRGRHSIRAHRVRRARCAGQVLLAERRQRIGAREARQRHRLCRMGARRRACAIGDARDDRDRRRQRRAVREESVQQRISRLDRILRRR